MSKDKLPTASYSLVSERGVKAVLKDLEKVQKSKIPKQLILAENLIFNIVFTLRKSDGDHLLQTTSIWVLINLLRIDVIFCRKAMLDAGVPAVLFEIINTNTTMSTSTKQYFSELCHYLCSTDPYAVPLPDATPNGPLAALLSNGGIVMAPDIGVHDIGFGSHIMTNHSNGQESFDDNGTGVSSDLSSSAASNMQKRYSHTSRRKNANIQLTDKQIANLAPFVPYRVDEDNMYRINKLFDYKSMQPFVRSTKSKSAPINQQLDYRKYFEKQPNNGGLVTENSVLTVDSYLLDNASNSYYDVPSLFDGSNSAGTYEGGFHDESMSDGFHNDFGADFDDNSTTYEHNHTLHTSTINAAFKKAEDYEASKLKSTSQVEGVTVVDQDVIQIGEAGMNSISKGSASKKGSKMPVFSPIKSMYQTNATVLTVTGVRKPAEIDKELADKQEKYYNNQEPSHVAVPGERAHSQLPSRTTVREQSNSFEGSYSNWNVGDTDHTIVSGKGAVGGGDSVSIPSYVDPYAQDKRREKTAYLTAQRDFEEEMKRQALLDAEASVTGASGTFTSSKRLFRLRNALPPVDSYAHGAHSRGGTAPYNLVNGGNVSRHLGAPSSRAVTALDSTFNSNINSLAGPFNQQNVYMQARPTTTSSFGGPRSTRGSTSGKRPMSNMQSGRGIGMGVGLDSMSTSTVSTASANRKRHLKGVNKENKKMHLDTNSMASVASVNSGISSVGAIDNMLSKLDPLSLNVNAALHPKFTDYAIGEVIDDGDGDTLDIEGESGPGFSDEMESLAQSRPGVLEYEERKKVRLRAEKLVDYSFTKRLFIRGKATVQDAQDLIHRMESIIQMLDKDRTGFITWESFSRLILSLAPPHLLRADVMSFLNAQSVNDEDMIDYKEFIISGKVMVINKDEPASKIPIQGWLTRQKMFTNEATTYTWKNHVEWYRGRKSQAMIWLMRYGQRAILLIDKMIIAQKYLAEIGKKARAKNHLISCGEKALYAEELRLNAMRSVVKRCIRARRFLTAKEEANRFLMYIAKNVLTFLAEKNNEGNEQMALMRILKKKKALEDAAEEYKRSRIHIGYSNFFNLHQRYQHSHEWLVVQAEKASKHSSRQDECRYWLTDFADGVLAQIKKVEDAYSWLEERANAMLYYCAEQDTVWLSLIRLGTNAYRYLVRQEEALEWLLDRARHVVEHCKTQDIVGDSLVLYGQKKLKFLNDREHAFAYMVRRKEMTLDLLERRQICFEYLKRIPQAFFAVEDKKEEMFHQLVKIANAAKRHMRNQSAAVVRLRFIADHAGATFRACNLAQLELKERGLFAKYLCFLKYWPTANPSNQQRVKEEVARVKKLDAKTEVLRNAMAYEDRWEADLHDAFNLIFKILAPPASGADVAPIPMLGRYALRRLFLEGALLNMNKIQFSEFILTMDHRALGKLAFEDVFYWFNLKANEDDLDEYFNGMAIAGRTAPKASRSALQILSSTLFSTKKDDAVAVSASSDAAPGPVLENSNIEGNEQEQHSVQSGETNDPSVALSNTNNGEIVAELKTKSMKGSVKSPSEKIGGSTWSGVVVSDALVPFDESRNAEFRAESDLNNTAVSGRSDRFANTSGTDFTMKSTTNSRPTSRAKSRPNKKRRVHFTLNDILSVHERAVITLFKRFGTDETKDDYDLEGYAKEYAKIKKKKAMDIDIDLRMYDYDF